MTSPEPAGNEGEQGKSAEFSVPAGAEGGTAGNTRGTVCGFCRRGAIRLQNLRASARSVGRGVPLPIFYFRALPGNKNGHAAAPSAAALKSQRVGRDGPHARKNSALHYFLYACRLPCRRGHRRKSLRQTNRMEDAVL